MNGLFTTTSRLNIVSSKMSSLCIYLCKIAFLYFAIIEMMLILVKNAYCPNVSFKHCEAQSGNDPKFLESKRTRVTFIQILVAGNQQLKIWIV
ncbi:MAG: hypothetical protein MUE81_00770 [Thermoflexibacter sp.]|nr:hypothetical protein [Thermoflexibacter sp.]